MRKLLLLMAILALSAPFVLCGCSGDDGATGATGATGAQGPAGADGTDGTNGAPGTPGATGPPGPPGASGTALVSEKHGAAVAAEAEDEGSLRAAVAITGATADASGVATVTFTVKNAANQPITGLGAFANAASFGIFSLAPQAAPYSYNKWVSYIWRPLSSSVTTNQAYRERPTTGGVIAEGPPGTYTYQFVQNLGTAKRPVDNVAITYDRSRTHRVFVALRGSSTGYSGGNTFDFVPAGGTVTQKRDIVDDATCRKCHKDTPGHYGPWNGIVKACVACHEPDSKLTITSGYQGNADQSIEFSVMLHRIHAGRELASVAGANDQFYDNPNTAVDETADNGPLYHFSNVNSPNYTGPPSFSTAAFPAVLANCQACHTGATLVQVDNWKNVPSRAACGSCHDLINWTTGAGHYSAQSNDQGCTICHPATGPGFGQSVTDAHDWTKKDIRNISEFDISLRLDKTSYSKGDKPVLTIVLKDHFTGATLDHTKVIEDNVINIPNTSNAFGEGCYPKAGFESTQCTIASDNLFTAANVYVVGPRAKKVAVLTYAARATVRSATRGPWDMSASETVFKSIRVKVDSAMPMVAYNTETAYEGYGADELISGDITVSSPTWPSNVDNTNATQYQRDIFNAQLAAYNAFFPTPAAATPAQVAAWLNANPVFHERAIAYVDEALTGNSNAGKLAIRSRGVSRKDKDGNVTEMTTQRNIQYVSGTPSIFTDTAVKTAGGADSVRIRSTASSTVPNAAFSTDNIVYTMDPVDDLVAGTYIVHVEYAEAGRAPTDASNGADPKNSAEPPYVNYRTPSVAVATFQVRAATEELPVAGNCTACHWSDAGQGFVLDYPRHNKVFDAKATDRCGACHDYASTNVSTATTQQYFEGSLSKRVHAVHNGAWLNYPTITVGHEETAAFGRNWNIVYPYGGTRELSAAINCESCHTAGTTSGSWKTKPNRLACMGCHDSDAATAHMKTQTFDPTPLAPWSGDEVESCKQCH